MTSAAASHRLAIAATCIAAMAWLSGCETVSQCMAGKSEIQALECRANAGDKQAQFALGEAAELGVGGPPDPARAARFYRQAAAFTSGMLFLYTPGVKGAAGTTMPIRTGPDQAGLPAAQYRLAKLYLDGRGVRRDRGRAVRLLKTASKGGYAPAQELLRSLGEEAP
jgi:TPR repeat protein